MSRDWQKDKRYLQELNNWEMDPDDEDLYKIATHYHQQYAAEKERADKAEEREEELRSAIAYVMENNLLYDAVYAYEHFEEILDSLYPKEETK